jgi:hypothetical protein
LRSERNPNQIPPTPPVPERAAAVDLSKDLHKSTMCAICEDGTIKLPQNEIYGGKNYEYF